MDGLWLAVTTTPATASNSRTVHDNCGVGRNSGYNHGSNPLAASTSAVICANSWLWWRLSHAMATRSGCSVVGAPCIFNRWFAKPCVAKAIVVALMRLVPGPILPRNPPVPKDKSV